MHAPNHQSQPQATQLAAPSAEQQIEALKQQLAEAQKMTALGELVSTTTHEFNNVLMTILNYAKMGLRHKDAATHTKCFEKILAASGRATKITNAVLGVARNRSTQPEPTDLEKLLEESLVLLEREMTKYRIAIEKRFETVPEAMVVGNQIQQVLLNLLINARQAMPDGGTIFLQLQTDAESGMVELTVRDTGSGIPADKLPRIFDRFYTTKSGPDESGKGGTGLGLASCKDIIDSHRGRIRVQSSPGKGTAFVIRLPAAVKQPAAQAPIAAPLSLGIPQANRTTA